MNWAWKLRGIADKFVGGIGIRRGRRHPEYLNAGDALDFWRVLLADLTQGLLGRLYWLAVLPFHGLLFPRMARNPAAGLRLAQGGLPGTLKRDL